MSKLVLQPAGGTAAVAHFHDTIERPVLQERIRRFVGPADAARLAVMFGEKPIATWGVTPGANGQNAAKWERVAPGDVVVFGQAGHVVATATVAYKVHSAPLAVDLWDRDEHGQTWEYVYFLDEVQATQIPYAELNRALGYAENYVIQGFTVVDEARSARAFAVFDLDSAFHPQPVSEAEYEQLAKDPELDPDAPLDAERRVKARKEQDFLRAYLFKGKAIATCGMCGRTYPVDLLVAAHIKPRARCTDEERRDYKHVVMPMCKFGCDDLFERGYIALDDTGALVARERDRMPPDVQRYIDQLAGVKCLYWTPSSAPYFAWHRRFHGTR